jgi:predicted nucleic acid-binding protein
MPTSYAVLDSGVLLATVQTELYTEHAKVLIGRLAQGEVQMIAPLLLRYELVSVARKWVYRELTTPDKAKTALDTLLRYPVSTVVDDGLLLRAYELASEYDRPTAYDAQYLAVSEHYQCDFWTADERLFNAVNRKFPRVYWLGNVKLEV